MGKEEVSCMLFRMQLQYGFIKIPYSIWAYPALKLTDRDVYNVNIIYYYKI